MTESKPACSVSLPTFYKIDFLACETTNCVIANYMRLQQVGQTTVGTTSHFILAKTDPQGRFDPFSVKAVPMKSSGLPEGFYRTAQEAKKAVLKEIQSQRERTNSFLKHIETAEKYVKEIEEDGQ
jgi:hypothetical protein